MTEDIHLDKESPTFMSPGGKTRDAFFGMPWVSFDDLPFKGYDGALENLMLLIGSMMYELEKARTVAPQVWEQLGERALTAYNILSGRNLKIQEAVDYNVKLLAQLNQVSRFASHMTGDVINESEDLTKALDKIKSSHESISGRDEALHSKVDLILSHLKIEDTHMTTSKPVTDPKKKIKSQAEILLYSHKSLLEQLKVQLAEDLKVVGISSGIQVFETKDSDFLKVTVSVSSKKLIEIGKILKDQVEGRSAKERAYTSNKSQKMQVNSALTTASKISVTDCRLVFSI